MKIIFNNCFIIGPITLLSELLFYFDSKYQRSRNVPYLGDYNFFYDLDEEDKLFLRKFNIYKTGESYSNNTTVDIYSPREILDNVY